MSAAVVETTGLSKAFGITPVLRGIDFTLEAGAAATITGGNGSGKSTLIRILGGLSKPTDGRATILGMDSTRLDGAHRRRVAMLTHQSWLYPNLTARENLEFHASLYGVADARGVAVNWIEKVGLKASSEDRVRGFSRGMEQRLSIARAAMTHPDLMLLDEPLAALDPEATAIVAELIRAAVARGCAVLITAHAPLDIGLAADRYELRRGRLMRFHADDGRDRVRSLSGAN